MVKKCLDFVKKHPLESVIAFLVIVLAYGFYATKYTINIDQLKLDLFDGNGLITAGRWSVPLIHFFTNWMEFSPFWHTSVMMCLFWISGLCWITLFNTASKNNIKSSSLIAFWIIYPVFPFVTIQITYPMLNIALAYVLVPFIICLLYPVLFENKFILKNAIISAVLMVICVDMYESFAAVYLVGMFGVLIIRYFYVDTDNAKQSKHFLYVIKTLFKNAVFILLSILIDFAISKIACYIASGSFHFYYSANTTFYWLKYGSIRDAVVYVFRELIAKYLIYGAANISIFIFDCMVLISVIYAVIKSIKKRSFVPIVLFAGLCLSSISLFFVLGSLIGDRMEQAMPLFVAFVWMIVWETLNRRKVTCGILTACTIMLVLSETQTTNKYAVRNYEIFEYEYSWMRSIGTELEKYDTSKKPVAFVVDDNSDNIIILPEELRIPEKSTNLLYSGYRKLMCRFWDSLLPDSYFECFEWILWKADFDISNTDSLIQALSLQLSPRTSNMNLLLFNKDRIHDGYYTMKRMGYNYQYPSSEQYELAETYLQPNDTSCKFKITETDEIIVVQLMSCEK